MRPRSGCWRSAVSPARGWRAVISVSTGSGRTICCSACCTRISAAEQGFACGPKSEFFFPCFPALFSCLVFLPWDRRFWRYKPQRAGDWPGWCHGVQAFMNELRSLRNALRRGPVVGLVLSVSLAAASPVAAQSLTDRFKSLFGGTPDEPAQSKPAPAPGQPPADDDIECPQVT